MALGEMALGKMALGETALGKMALGKMVIHRQHHLCTFSQKLKCESKVFEEQLFVHFKYLNNPSSNFVC
jgi:hypothetical protein